ncbi:MAG: ABC transporter permease [Gammaproteobacteria bacterium HGW-Gammaproteobacteria-1]|jgi:putative ABC transport system permease protein|nr:MAG: ABC transporter permease [Gammaproteobacteria bacterium HGW-Gammaproteobacteria-1]
MNTLTLALRGLTRNHRRSIVTLLAIAFGFAAISLFAGYTHNIYSGLARQSIHGELLGHLTLSKRGMSTAGKLDPQRYLLTLDEVARIEAALQHEPQITLIAPRLAFSGLVTNGRASTIFIAEGISPQAMDRLQENMLTEQEARSGMYDRLAKKLDPARESGVALSAGLVELLHLHVGGEAILLVNTLSGQANAMDVTVDGSFNTGNAGTNDKFAFVPLALAQSLLDAEGRADRLTLLLEDVTQTEAIRDRLLAKLSAAGFDLEIATWQELSSFYRQVHGMFNMIFGFIFSIVLAVVLMSVANSVGMTVIERTREIGTLRAIGLKRSGVIRLFATETLLLTLLGCGVGFLLTVGVRYGINGSHIAYTPPNGANAVPLLVDMDYPRILLTMVLMLAVGMLAAFLPSFRSARQHIIDALGHV